MPKTLFLKSLLFLTLFTLQIATHAQLPNDPLPSWNDGPTKQRIIEFTQQVTNPKNPNYVPPAERIATFDNDGTLWVEQPLYTQSLFAIAQVKAMSAQHPEWQTTEPFKTVLSGDPKAIANLNTEDIARIFAVTHSGMSVEQFQQTANQWLSTAQDPHFKQLHTALVYQPMLEVMSYLRANGFKTYIVSGGGQEFIRVFAESKYGIPPEQVIGTTEKTAYDNKNGSPVLIKQPVVLLISNNQGKAEAINLFIGRKPIMAFGNADGDRQMLEWTQSRPGAHFMALVHHDDAAREYSYGPDSKIGTFSDALMAEAKQQGWAVISMRQDWKVVFPFEEGKKAKQ